MPRFGQLGVIASMQPVHATPSPTPGDVWSTNIGDGARRARLAVDEHRQGQGPARVRQRLAGHDLRSARPACTSRSRAPPPTACPKGGWLPAERLPLRQAIEAYTRDGAWASFDEQRKGTLARDMLADIVVLSDDIFSGPPAA